MDVVLIESYFEKLARNCMKWVSLLSDLPEDFDPRILGIESTLALKSGLPLRYFQDEPDNDKARKAAKQYIKIEKICQLMIVFGIEKSVVNTFFDDFILMAIRHVYQAKEKRLSELLVSN